MGFSGQWGTYADPESAPSQAGSPLVLMGVRYYDPITGRFTSRDPLGDDINDYAYCDNNPVEQADPSGRTYYDAADAFDRCREDIATIAKQYGIQPELLGAVVYREQYAGGKPSLWNDAGSKALFLAGSKRSIGITQVQIDPKKEKGCNIHSEQPGETEQSVRLSGNAQYA